VHLRPAVLNSRGKTAPTGGFWMIIQTKKTAIPAEKTSCLHVCCHLEGRRWRLVSRYTMMPDGSGNMRPGTVSDIVLPQKSL